MTISARLEEIRDRVVRAAERAGREPGDVRLIAVSKTRPPEDVHAALAAGVSELGENKIQEAEAKIPAVAAGEGVRWHFIGHLQKNKARKAVELFDVIHSVDSRAIGERIDRIAGELGKVQPVLVQVDLAGEATKHGVAEAELAETLRALSECRHLRLEGLMVLPPIADDPDDVRPYFRKLRELAADARERGWLASEELSMGMTHDFEIAIEEGATLVRLGTAIFGPRAKKEPAGPEAAASLEPAPTGSAEH